MPSFNPLTAVTITFTNYVPVHSATKLHSEGTAHCPGVCSLGFYNSAVINGVSFQTFSELSQHFVSSTHRLHLSRLTQNFTIFFSLSLSVPKCYKLFSPGSPCS